MILESLNIPFSTNLYMSRYRHNDKVDNFSLKSNCSDDSVINTIHFDLNLDLVITGPE